LATTDSDPSFRGRYPCGPLTRYSPLRKPGFPPGVSQRLWESGLYGEVRGLVSSEGCVPPLRSGFKGGAFRSAFVLTKLTGSARPLCMAELGGSNPLVSFTTATLRGRCGLINHGEVTPGRLHPFWTSGRKATNREGEPRARDTPHQRQWRTRNQSRLAGNATVDRAALGSRPRVPTPGDSNSLLR
jgi:hypothetical protein